MNEVNSVVNDVVNHPSHYTRDIECIDCIKVIVEHLNGEEAFLAGQVVKYLYRCSDKGYFLQDLKKAQWYMNRLVDKISSKYKL